MIKVNSTTASLRLYSKFIRHYLNNEIRIETFPNHFKSTKSVPSGAGLWV